MVKSDWRKTYHAKALGFLTQTLITLEGIFFQKELNRTVAIGRWATVTASNSVAIGTQTT